MGLAIIVPSISFGDANLGKVTLSGNVPIRGLYINLENSYTGTTVDLVASFLPANTTQRNVVWNIESGNEYASISGSILTILQGATNNEVTIKCTSASNPSIYATKTISVTYQGGEIIWHDFTSDMITNNRTISSSDGKIEVRSSGTGTRDVLILPIPNGVSAIKLKIVGSCTNQHDTIAFLDVTAIPQSVLPKLPTHFVSWNSVADSEITIPVQSGDMSVVCWQQVNETVYGINNKMYAFV